MSERMELATAIRHLRKRAAQIESVDSRHRPHWTQADLDAIAAVVDIPASAEQIALARIWGLAQNSGYVPEVIRQVSQIASKALGGDA